MSTVIRENGEKDLFAEVALAADELYSIRETFFPVNPDEKTSLLQSKSDLALQLLDAIPPGKPSICIFLDFVFVTHVALLHKFLNMHLTRKYQSRKCKWNSPKFRKDVFCLYRVEWLLCLLNW